MIDWAVLWCFYNASALDLVTGTVLLGGIAVVVPALVGLQTEHNDDPGFAETPYVEYRAARRAAFLVGIITMVLSVSTVVLYLNAFTLTRGDTCRAKEPVPPGLPLSLSLLILSSVLVILAFGFFYASWQNALRKQESLPGHSR